MSQLNLQIVEAEKPKMNLSRLRRMKKKVDLEELFFGMCECRHPKDNHEIFSSKEDKLIPNECCYVSQNWCDCLEFTQMDFEMEIIITNADVFSYENPNLIYNSLEWWIKIGEFLKCSQQLKI